MKLINKIKKVFLVGLATLLMFTNNVFAASYSISLTSDTVIVGNTVSLRITGSNVTGRFNIASSNSNVASPDKSSVWVENDTQYITINTKNTGNATLTITPSKTSATDDPENIKDINLDARTINITVNPKPTNNNTGGSTGGGSSNTTKPRPKSTNSYLSSLTVDGYDLNESFDKESLEYTLTVPANTESVKINAQLAEDSAKVVGTGEVKVSEGLNTFEIVVTAENGSKRTYVLKITVEAEKPIEVKIDNKTYNVIRKRKDLPKISEYFEEKEVEINGEKIEGYYNDTLKYTLVGLKDTTGTTSYYIYKNSTYTKYQEHTFNGTTLQIIDKTVPNTNKTTFTYDSDKITSYQEVKLDLLKNTYALDNNEIEGNQYYLFYAINVETGKESLYQYDATEKTIQRYNTQILDLYKERSDKYYLCVLASLLLLGLTLIISTMIVINKGKKKRPKTKVLEPTEKPEPIIKDIKEESPIIEFPNEEEKIKEEPLTDISKEEEPDNEFSFDDLPIKKAIEPIQIPLELKNINLIIEGDPNITAKLDPSWTSESLLNIIKNACEHTNKNGTIKITISDNPIYTEIVISDNGTGIKEEDINHIFERFYKGSNSKDSIGIGLNMSKKIINLENGDITVSSTLGKGSTFTIKFYKKVI